jgi:demethylmenaquinone methyltransferase / 2-methoxy-6-polyprenyl-1,4-benzoquinol methylase
MKGTTPEGTRSEQEASRYVREMFGKVAHRYDLLNHLLSFQIDRYWRAKAVRRVQDVLRRPEARVIDLCCGTGDLLLALESRAGRPLLGSDFCHPMLVAAALKIRNRGRSSMLFEADALELPLQSGSVDLVTMAFGFRNLANYEAGLCELRRVLRPGGKAAILEFSQPPNAVFRSAYNFYSRRVLPMIGSAISGSRDAYTYLPDSVRKFPSPEALVDAMQTAGFRAAHYEYMTGGIVALHVGLA